MNRIQSAKDVASITHYDATCSVCGYFGRLEHAHPSVRESFSCIRCRASLRYRHQAEILLAYYSQEGSSCLVELAQEARFSQLEIYEPGIVGPFRRHFGKLPGYVNSAFWPDVPAGDLRDSIRCENLEQLTFPDRTFDLIISSDILEHVRKPGMAFAESYRVLRPGGAHIFTVPFAWPLAQQTVRRVDVSGDQDVHLLEPRYHGNPLDPRGALVYNDFGLDIADALREVGFSVRLPRSLLYNLTVVALRQ